MAPSPRGSAQSLHACEMGLSHHVSIVFKFDTTQDTDTDTWLGVQHCDLLRGDGLHAKPACVRAVRSAFKDSISIGGEYACTRWWLHDWHSVQRTPLVPAGVRCELVYSISPICLLQPPFSFWLQLFYLHHFASCLRLWHSRCESFSQWRRKSNLQELLQNSHLHWQGVACTTCSVTWRIRMHAYMQCLTRQTNSVNLLLPCTASYAFAGYWECLGSFFQSGHGERRAYASCRLNSGSDPGVKVSVSVRAPTTTPTLAA